jgi:hypothetical protein
VVGSTELHLPQDGAGVRLVEKPSATPPPRARRCRFDGDGDPDIAGNNALLGERNTIYLNDSANFGVDSGVTVLALQ